MTRKILDIIQAQLSHLSASCPQLPDQAEWQAFLSQLHRLSHQTERQELLLETVTAISDAASSILEVDELLQVSVNLIREYFDFYFVGVYLTDETGKWASLQAGTGEMSPQVAVDHFLSGKVGEASELFTWSIYHRQARIALDVGEDAVHFRNPLLPATRSEIVLPLINRGQVIGALDIQSVDETAFGLEDIALLQPLADQLANAIQNVNLLVENDRLLIQAENNRRFLKTVIEHIPDPIFIKDKNHILLEMNQANANVMGQPEHVLLGKSDADFFPPELAEKFSRRDAQVFATQQILEAEDTTIWGDGLPHIAYTRLIPITTTSGEAEYLLGITQDVTESRARQAEREGLLAETRALYQGSRSLAGAFSERQIFETLFSQIREQQPCEIVAFRFYMVDDEPTWAELRANWQKNNQPTYSPSSRLYLPDTDQARLLTAGRPIFINTIATDERLSPAERASFAPTQAASAAILPLSATGQTLGVVLIYFTSPYTFSDEIQRLWLALSDQAGIALVNRQLIQEAAYRAVRMETAAEVARAASSTLDLQELLNATVNLIRDHFELYYVGAFLVDEAKAWAVLKAGTGEEGLIQLQKQHRLKIGGESMIGWSIDQRQPRIALDVGKEAVRFQNPDLPQTRSEMALPLIYHNEAIGALTIQSQEQAAFSREDILVLQTMADQLANAVKNAQLFTQAQQEITERERSEARLTDQQHIFEMIAKGLPLTDILTTLAKFSEAYAPNAFCSILLMDENGANLRRGAAPSLPESFLQAVDGLAIGPKAGPCGTAAYRREQILSVNIAADPLWEDYADWIISEYGLRACWSTPILATDGQVLGTFAMYYSQPHRPSQADLDLVAASTYLAGIAIERKQAEEELRQSQSRLELALRGADLGLWDVNVKTGADIVDQRAAEMLGYNLAEVGSTLSWWDQHTHPDDLARINQAWEAHLLDKTPLYECEYRLRTKSGEWKWILDRGKIVERDPADQPLRLTGTHLDITERKQAEEAVRESEERYRAIFEQSSDMICIIAPEGDFLTVNQAGLDLFGYTRDELIGLNIAQVLVTPADYSSLVQMVQEKGLVKEFESKFRKKSGLEMDCMVSLNEWQDDHGNIIGYQGIIRDRTVRKQAEAALARQAKLSAFSAAVGLALTQSITFREALHHCTEAMVLHLDAAFARIWTLNEADNMLELQASAGLYTHLDGAHGRVPVGQFKIGLIAQERQPHLTNDVLNDPRVGDPAWAKREGLVAFAGYPLIVGDHLVGVMAMFAYTPLPEATLDAMESVANTIALAIERKRAEERLRANEALLEAIIDNASASIYVLDAQGRFLLINNQFAQIFGLDKQAVIGKTDYDIFPQETAEGYQNADLEILKKGAPLQVEEAVPQADGLHTYITIKSPLLDAQGAPYALCGIATDITPRKRAEESLHQALNHTQLLYNISEALATLVNQQAAFETVLGEYLLLLKVSRGGIMLLDPAGEYNRLGALYVDNRVVAPDLIFPVEDDLVARYLVENPFPLVIEDAHTHPLTKHNQALRGSVYSMLFVPISVRGHVVGILGADATTPGHTFSPEEIRLGETIADQLAIWLDNHQLLAETQYRSNLLQTAAEVSRVASSILDVTELINTSVNLIRDQFDYYYVGLFLVDEAREWAVLRAGTGEAGRVQLENGHKLKIGGGSMIGWCIDNRQARIALDVGQEAVRFQNPVLPETRSEMALPLLSRGTIIGALTVQSTERGAFSAEDITVLQTMADQLANGIENARLFEQTILAQQETEKVLWDTQALQEFSQKLAGTLQVERILNFFFEACSRVLGFEYAQFSVVDEYQHRVRAIAGYGISEAQIRRANHSLDSHDIMAVIVKTGQTEIISGWDDRFDREQFEAEGHRNWVRLFTPITLRQKNIGLVEVGFNKTTQNQINDAQIKLLRAFIDQTTLAMDNAQRYEASQKAATREALIKEITTKVRSTTNLDTILQVTAKEVGEAMGSKRTYVHLISPPNGDTRKR
jgi:PAS domain S-box-containing protein